MTTTYAETQLHDERSTWMPMKCLLLRRIPNTGQEMYYGVKMGIRTRGKTLYLGGNGLNCEIEMLDEQTMKVKMHTRDTTRGLESRFISTTNRSKPARCGLHRYRYHDRCPQGWSMPITGCSLARACVTEIRSAKTACTSVFGRLQAMRQTKRLLFAAQRARCYVV